MTLFEGRQEERYTVKGLYVEEDVTRRLQALGLNDGTVIQVLNHQKNGAMIIQVRGTRLALGRHISSGIEVAPERPRHSEQRTQHRAQNRTLRAEKRQA